MRLVKWMLPELGLLNFLLLPFLVAFWLLVVITWPIHGPIRWLWRRHRAAAERERVNEVLAREQAQWDSIRAAEAELERENEAHRAAGEYVPQLSDNGVRRVCSGVALIYGEAYELARHGIPAAQLQTALDHAEAKFGWTLDRVFGVEPQSALRAGTQDFGMCLAVTAFRHAAEDLVIISGDDSDPLLKGTEGSQALGVFTRAAGTTTGFGFVRQHFFFDQYQVARNFVPDRAYAEEYYRLRKARNEAFEAERFEAGMSIPQGKVTGVFGPELTWLSRDISVRAGLTRGRPDPATVPQSLGRRWRAGGESS